MKKYFLSQDKQWEKEANIWAAFYLLFNDDNVSHMENSFQSNNGFDMSADELHEMNLDWVKQIGVSTLWKNKNIPKELVDYATEYFFDSLGPGYDQVMREGKLILSETNRMKTMRIDIYRYKDELYSLIWNLETGENYSYTTVEDKRKEYPNWFVWKKLDKLNIH